MSIQTNVMLCSQLATTMLLGLIKTVLNIWRWVLLAVLFMPTASAASVDTLFPDVPFSAFSQVISEQFSADISLATVVMILSSLIHNTEMLNLHGRQQTKRTSGENKQTVTSWMKAFVWSLQKRLGSLECMFSDDDNPSSISHDAQVSLVAAKMNTLVNHLGLSPYAEDGRFQGWLAPVSTSDIQPVQLLCPISAECRTDHCHRALRHVTPRRDMTMVTLCEGATVYSDVAVLSGLCPGCNVCACVCNLTYKDG